MFADTVRVTNVCIIIIMTRTSRRFVYSRLLSPGNLFVNDR